MPQPLNLLNLHLQLDPRLNKSDKAAGRAFLRKLNIIIGNIGKRNKSIEDTGMLYDTPSVWMFDQAKDLHILGYFVSSIIICRSTAEYLAFEIFNEEVEIEGKDGIVEAVVDTLDFRKVVNEFLYNPKRGFDYIDKQTADLFNQVYDLGNRWVHPKRIKERVKIEELSLESLTKLKELIYALRDVMKDYDIKEGKLYKKAEGRKKIRPVELGIIRS